MQYLRRLGGTEGEPRHGLTVTIESNGGQHDTAECFRGVPRKNVSADNRQVSSQRVRGQSSRWDAGQILLSFASRQSQSLNGESDIQLATSGTWCQRHGPNLVQVSRSVEFVHETRDLV